MITLFTSKWCSGPTAYWTIQYEYFRDGAAMCYRFNWRVWLQYPDSWYNNALQLQLFLDGYQINVSVKGKTTNATTGWSYSGTTPWYSVYRQSGSTQFYAKLYDVSAGTIEATSGTSYLTVTTATSSLGSIPSFDVDDGATVAITKYDSSYTDTLAVSYGDTTIKTISGITNGTKVTFNENELATIYGLMRDVQSGTFTFTLTTTSGDTSFGTSKQTATGSITNANPTFAESNVTYADTDPVVVGVTENNQHIVQNKSFLRVYFTEAAGNKGATISQYAVTVNGVEKTATASGHIDFGAINTSQNTKISVVVTDSRGNTTTVTKDMTVLAYATPTFTVELNRLNNYEDETHLKVNASIASVNDKNVVTVSYKKKQAGGEYGAYTTIANKTKHTTSCDKNYAFVFLVTVSDKFESVTKEFDLPKGKFPLFINTEKNSVGINEFPTEGEALRVAGGVACFDDGIVLKTASKSFKITIDDSGALVIAELK